MVGKIKHVRFGQVIDFDIDLHETWQGLEHSSLMRESMKVPLHYIKHCIYILCFAAFPPQPESKAAHHTVRTL